jgi:hypothetical protein
MASAAVSLLLTACTAPASAQCRAEKLVVDNRIVFVLENEHVKMTLSPENGRATELLFKALAGERNMASRYGLFGEVAPGFGGTWTGQIAEDGPDRVAVEFVQSGGRPPQWHLTLVKTFRLERNQTSVTVHYAVRNKGDGPAKIALRPHHGLRFPGPVEGLDGMKSEDSWFYFPAPQGVRTMLDRQPQPRPGEHPVSGDFVEVDPADGWTAGRGRSGVAFAVTMDWSRLDALLDWCDKFTGATVEWGCTEIALQPGEHDETGYTFSFYTGMPPVYGARADVAVGLQLPEPLTPGERTPVRVAVAGGRKRTDVTVTLEHATRPEERGTVIGEATLNLAPGAAQQAAFDIVLTDDATHVLTAVVRESGREIARGVCVVPLGRTTRGYLAPRQAGAKRGDSYWGKRFREIYAEADTTVPEHYGKMDLDTVTPHVRWLKPHAPGAARVMFVTRPDYFKYSVREICQRCEIVPDFTLVFQKKRAGVFMEEAYREDVIEAMARMIEQGPYDALYFCNLNWDWLPEDFRARLLDRVEQGLGIVVAGEPRYAKPLRDALTARAAGQTADGARLLAGISPPAELGVRLNGLETSTLGKGRAVFLNYAVFNMYDHFLPNALPAEYPLYPWWEQLYALYGRTMLWAAGKEAGLTVAPGDLTAAGAAARVSGPAAGEVQRIRFVAVDDDLAEVAHAEAPVADGAAACVWPAPLSNGRFTVGMIALNAAGESLGFAGRTIRIESPVTLNLRIDRPFVRGAERPKVEVTLATPQPLRGRLDVRLTDSHGRVVFQREDEVATGGERFTYDLAGVRPVTVGHQFTADLRIAGTRVATAGQPIRFWPERSRVDEDFSGAVWGTVNQAPYAEALLRSARACGIDRLYVGPTTRNAWSSLTMAVNLGFDFYMLDLNTITDLFTYGRANEALPDSPWDDAVFAAAANQAREWAERCRDVAVDHYILRDEYLLCSPGKDMTQDSTPQTLAAFRAFLQRDYAGLEALNAEWETSFTGWDEISRPEPKNVPDWNDWQAFWDTYMVKHMAVTRKAVQSVNPRAKVGMSGCQRPGDGRGWDWWLLMKEGEYFHRYNHFQEDWINSFGSGNVIQGQWFGYLAATEVAAQYDIWSNLLTGSHLVAYYKLLLGSAPNQDMAIASHDFRLRPYYTYVAKEMARVKTGLARQILSCRHQGDPIAIYHSQRSNLTGGDTLNATYAFKRLIEDSGFRFLTVDSREVLAGALQRRGIKALILPQVVCVSEAERAVLAAFVDAGGTLVTDQNTGLRDGHGKLRAGAGVLDGLFGIVRQSKEMAGKTTGMFAATPHAGAALRGYRSLQVAAASRGIAPATAQAWLQTEEGTPALMVNAVGRGRTVYLNIDLANYASSAAGGVGGEVTEDTQGVVDYTSSCVELMRGVLADTTGLTPRASVWADGKPLADTRVYYLANGDLDLVCFLRGRAAAPAKATVKLPRKAHVYELRSAPQYFGETAEVEMMIQPAVGVVFALLPYAVDKVELEAPARARPGEVVHVRGRVVPQGGANGAAHVVRLEVRGPDGKPLDCFAANLDAPGGVFSRELPLALNDPAGAWTVTATDVISRKAASAAITIATDPAAALAICAPFLTRRTTNP